MPKIPSSTPDEPEVEVGKERPSSSPPRREIDAVASTPRVWMVALELSPSGVNVGNTEDDEVEVGASVGSLNDEDEENVP